MTTVYDRDGNEIGGFGRLTDRDIDRRVLLASLPATIDDDGKVTVDGSALDDGQIRLVREADEADWRAAWSMAHQVIEAEYHGQFVALLPIEDDT